MADEKRCVMCGESCAGQPRLKNAQGQYAHKACAEAKHAGAAHAPAPASTSADDDLSLGLDDGLGDGLDDILLGDLPTEEPAADMAAGGMRQACPGCGAALDGSAVICMGCGFDTRSGKAKRVKVGKVKEPGKQSALAAVASGAGGAAASGMGFVVGSLIGACLAGAIGAALWAGLIIGIEREMNYIGIITGILCGFGAVMGARGQAGMMTGTIATMACIAAICVGKYVGIKHLTDKQIATVTQAQSTFYEDMTPREMEDYATAVRADEILQQRLDEGGLDEETATEYQELVDFGFFPDEYPRELVSEVRKEWRAKSDEERLAYFEAEQAEMTEAFNAYVEEEREHIYEEGFMATFDYRDIIFFGFAIVVAFGTGSGMGQD